MCVLCCVPFLVSPNVISKVDPNSCVMASSCGTVWLKIFTSRLVCGRQLNPVGINQFLLYYQNVLNITFYMVSFIQHASFLNLDMNIFICKSFTWSNLHKICDIHEN